MRCLPCTLQTSTGKTKVIPNAREKTGRPKGEVTADRYETEVEVKVKKVKHLYYVYECTVCGQKVIYRTPPEKRTKRR